MASPTKGGARTIVQQERGKWCEIEVRWTNDLTRVRINGIPLPAVQPEFTSGQVGPITHAAVARFDQVFLGVPFGDQEFFENFASQSG